MYTGVWFIAADINILRVFSTAKFSHNVFGQIDKNRTRTTSSCNIESFFDDTSEIFTVTNCNSIFCDAAGDTDNVNFLKSVISNQMSCNLSGKAYKRNTVIIGCRKSGDKVSGTRATGYQTDTDFTGGSCISIGFMHQGLFMSWQYDINPALFV